ncbi:MAG: hypothetical protein J7J71_05635 [Deltaproteobacteria bacterium]|nr:hypothetical protein [Candidatus Tharpella sp.]
MQMSLFKVLNRLSEKTDPKNKKALASVAENNRFTILIFFKAEGLLQEKISPTTPYFANTIVE